VAKKGDGKKGFFSFLRLPISKQYLWPDSRRILILIGAIGCLAFLLYFAFDRFVQKNRFISKGPLSTYHASLEKDCTACHTPLKSVLSEKCAVCHELVGDKIGTYSYPAHYIYRSGNRERLKTQSAHQVACFGCHSEHMGRDQQITDVPDARCLACHAFGSFNSKHPEFEFAAKKEADDANLQFPHIQHVREVMKKGNFSDVEKACLTCHVPDSNGRGFQPISFDHSCDSCHLTATDKTPALQEKDPANPGAPGALSLETIQKNHDPGTMWAFFINPSEVSKRGGGIVKSPLYHKDPWIMYNLQLIRRTLYPNQGLSDLLTTSGITSESPAQEAPARYQEALQTLKEYAAELRGRPEPEVQADLKRIDDLIKVVERKINNPTAAMDMTPFEKPLQLNPKLSKEQVEALKTFALDLTEPCRKCHIVSDASIQRVQTDQKVLHRAEFSHRAHILQRRCLDCHTTIPIAESLKSTGTIDPSKDNSAIQNIPTIDTCKQCHRPDLVSNRCVKCHEFHPNKVNRSQLLLYME